MSKEIDFAAVDKAIEDGYIKVQHHPTAPLRILNYSQKAQFEWRWTPETMACRGLIVSDDNEIVARPFKKFFSYEQLDGKVPDEPFEMTEKMDGSLGILYRIDGHPYIASRGSFVSEQAIAANKIFTEKYSHCHLDDTHTYLFEIVYPDNRIVVDYGETEDLFWLAMIETATGIEKPLMDIGLPRVRSHSGLGSIDDVLAMNEKNREGFVLRFHSGQRVKIKFDEYKRLHKLLTGVSSKSVWEMLKGNEDISLVLEDVPREYYDWIKTLERDLREAFCGIEARANEQFKVLDTRKDTAMYFQQCDYPSIMFAMLDGKDYKSVIWKMIRPESVQVFKCDGL